MELVRRHELKLAIHFEVFVAALGHGGEARRRRVCRMRVWIVTVAEFDDDLLRILPIKPRREHDSETPQHDDAKHAANARSR